MLIRCVLSPLYVEMFLITAALQLQFIMSYRHDLYSESIVHLWLQEA